MLTAPNVFALVRAASRPAVALSCPNGIQSLAVVELCFRRNIGEVLGVSEDAWTKTFAPCSDH